MNLVKINSHWEFEVPWYLDILQTSKIKMQVGKKQFAAEANQMSKEETKCVFGAYALEHADFMHPLTFAVLDESPLLLNEDLLHRSH